MLRAAAPNEPLVLARDVVDDGEAVAAQLRDLTAEEGGLITMMDEDVRPLLETMTPDALLAVLLILLREKRMDLDDHGRPGWSLQMFGLSIVITRRPSGRLSDVVDAVLRTTAQD